MYCIYTMLNVLYLILLYQFFKLNYLVQSLRYTCTGLYQCAKYPALHMFKLSHHITIVA